MPRKYPPLEERFWNRVDKRGPDECWPWLGPIHGKVSPRGSIHANGRNRWVQQVAWEIGNQRAVPEGAFVLHRCGNSACVNPGHLYLGDFAANARDRDDHGRTARGERNGKSRLTEVQVAEIRRRVAAGEQKRAVARSIGVHETTVLRIVRGEMWT